MAVEVPLHLQSVIDSAERQIKNGAEIFFKWTCAHCGARETFEQKNTFYVEGECEECHQVTNLMTPVANVNFLLVAGPDAQVGKVLESFIAQRASQPRGKDHE